MTPLHECFMLDAALRLDAAAIVAIYKSGYTRIPVFQGLFFLLILSCFLRGGLRPHLSTYPVPFFFTGSPSNVVGILYAKDLVLVNPLDELELSTLVGLRGQLVGRTYAHERLDGVLQVGARAHLDVHLVATMTHAGLDGSRQSHADRASRRARCRVVWGALLCDCRCPRRGPSHPGRRPGRADSSRHPRRNRRGPREPRPDRRAPKEPQGPSQPPGGPVRIPVWVRAREPHRGRVSGSGGLFVS